MNSKALNHLINKLRFPEQARVNQEAYNKKRLEDVELAKQIRPHYLPIRHDLPAAAQTMPVSEASEELRHDVIVYGAITDGEQREINFFLRRTDQSFLDVGDEPDVHLSLDAVAGKKVAAAGFAGVHKFVTPFLLREKERLTLEIFKPQATAGAEVVYTVLNALRVFTPQHREGELTERERAEVLESIRTTVAPQMRYLVAPVEFNANGEARTESPRQDEPILITGFRANFTDALVSWGFTSNDSFSNSPIPIWAFANEKDNAQQLYCKLLYPLFVPAGQQLYFKLKNTVDGVNYATDGQIEIEAKTP